MVVDRPDLWGSNHFACLCLTRTMDRLISKFLETYSLEEIIQINDLTEEEVLLFLVEQEFLKLPNPKPCDLND